MRLPAQWMLDRYVQWLVGLQCCVRFSGSWYPDGRSGESFACHDEVKDWFHSYRSGRTQVYCVGPSSVSTRLMCGISQGSIIGPSQFVAYTEDVKDVISPMSHHLYAEETQMLAKATMQSLGTCRSAPTGLK